jgi:hypothetical protein
MEKSDILEIVDRCLTERLKKMRPRPASNDVRKLSLTCQQVLYEVYAELRTTGAVGGAEDILRNVKIKDAIATLPREIGQLARDILICAHSGIKEQAES